MRDIPCESTTVMTLEDLELYEKEHGTFIAKKDNSKKKKKTRTKSKSSSKKSKSKENHSTPSVVVSNEPESENDRKEAYSSTIVTPTPVTIIEPTPKKNKLTNCLKKKRKSADIAPVVNVVDDSEPHRDNSSQNKSAISNLVIVGLSNDDKTCSKSLPEGSLLDSKKKTKKKKRVKRRKVSKQSTNEKTKRKRRRTSKKKISSDDSSEEDYFSDQFLFELDEDNDFTCLTEQEIVAEQTREIQEVGEILSIGDSAAICLLKYFKWNRDKLMTSYFDNPDKVLEAAGVKEDSLQIKSRNEPSSESILSARIQESEDEEIECSICCCEYGFDEIYSLKACNHIFCIYCWEQYLSIQINEGQSFVHCAHTDCLTLVPEEDVKQLVDEKTFQKYCTFFMQSFVDNNDNVKWCPAPGCGNAVTSDMVNGKTVTCRCSYQFCFRCSEEAHQPASCKQVKLWQKKCQDESETNNWIIANTQECPKCSLPTEKNGGCNHMTCRQCKHEYCWICYKDWKGHNDFYSCNRYQKSKDDKKGKKGSRKEREQQRLATRAALERYLHYHSRFANHAKSNELEITRKKAADKASKLKESESTTAEVLFIEEACQELKKSRSILKYSYVFRYYMEENDTKTSLLEYLQEDLEKTVEDLSEALNTPTMEHKLKIVNLTALTETRAKNILDAVDRG